MPENQIAARFEMLVEFVDKPTAKLGIEIDHDVSTEDHVERLVMMPVRLQVQLVERDHLAIVIHYPDLAPAIAFSAQKPLL